MLNYKVEVEQKTQRIIIRWFDEQGNECEPESGTYEVTIPKDTFIWYGDNLSCEGKQGNDEYKYTFVVSAKPPMPQITPILKNAVIHYIVDNSAVEGNYRVLGYTTNAELIDKPFSLSSEFDFTSKFVSNAVVKDFGYDENKCEYQVFIDEDYEFEPNKKYTITLMPNIVYNQGLGEEFSEDKVYNNAVAFSFLSTPQPTLTPIKYSVDKNIFTIDFKLDNYHSTNRDGWETTILSSRNPTIFGGGDNAFVISSEVNGDILTLRFSCRDQRNFIKKNADGTQSYTFTLQTSDDYLLNFGDNTNFVGIQGNYKEQKTYSIPIVNDTPIPQVVDEIRDSDSLTTQWSGAYIANLTTKQQSTPKMYANMLNGEKIDITSHIKVTMPTNTKKELYIDFDSENNFGLDPTLVYNYVIEYPTAMLKNEGDGKVYEGTTTSKKYEYSYFPIENIPSLDIVATNVNPLFPLITGNNLTLHNDRENITIEADSINISNHDNTKVLMGVNREENIKDVDLVESLGEFRLLQDDTDDCRFYNETDLGKKEALMYFAEGNTYEQNNKGVVYLNINGAKIYTDGNGIDTLGKLYATEDTISIKKYVLEVKLKQNVITNNTLGGFVDWNADAFASEDDIPQRMGDTYWGETPNHSCILPDGHLAYATSGNMMYNFFDAYWQLETITENKSEFPQGQYDSALGRVNSLEGEGKEECEYWFKNIYLKENPIKLTGDTPSNLASYTDYLSFMSSERMAEVYFSFWNYCNSLRIRQKALLYNKRTTLNHTYSFLFDKPVEHLKLGSRYSSYSSNGEQYSPLITGLLKLDTSKQTDFKYFLYNQNSFSKWSAETDFDGTTDITGLLYQSSYDFISSRANSYFDGYINTKSKMNDVVTATSAFCGNMVMQQLPNCFEFKNLKDGSYMFYETRYLWNLPTSFNPTQLENADFMFYIQSRVSWGDYKMFTKSKEFIDSTDRTYKYYDTKEKKFLDIPNANTIECLSSIDLSLSGIQDTWTSVSKICTANAMFKNRYKLAKIPMGWNFSSLENGEDMFNGCQSLEKTPTAWTSTDKLKVANNMFYGCDSLTTIHSGFKCNNIDTAIQMFADCTNLTNLNEDFNPKNLRNANGMFSKCVKLDRFPSSWTSIKDIQTTTYMFNSCTSIKTLPSVWTDCNALSATSMFSLCSNLEECNIHFNCFIEGNDIFSECNKLTKVEYINLGENCDSLVRPISKCANLFDFKLDNYGRVENYAKTVSKKKDDFILYITFYDTQNEFSEENKEKLVNSWVYLLDHLWTGETIGNQTSIEALRHDTHNRSDKSQNCIIKFYGLNDLILKRIRDNVTTQVAKDVLDTYMNGAERKWDYILEVGKG